MFEKIEWNLIKKTVLPFVFFLIGAGSIMLIKQYWKGYPDDNVIEEFFEDELTDGVFDFTPMSEEDL